MRVPRPPAHWWLAGPSRRDAANHALKDRSMSNGHVSWFGRLVRVGPWGIYIARYRPGRYLAPGMPRYATPADALRAATGKEPRVLTAAEQAEVDAWLKEAIAAMRAGSPRGPLWPRDLSESTE